MVSIDGYTLVRLDRGIGCVGDGDVTKAGGGICIYCRDTLKYDVDKGQSIMSGDFEL